MIPKERVDDGRLDTESEGQLRGCKRKLLNGITVIVVLALSSIGELL